MKNKEYQRSHNEQPCSFKSKDCAGDIVGHHIRVAGMCGTGLKMGDEFVIPVCAAHHSNCDSRVMPTAIQLNMMMAYWLERLVQEHGVVKSLEMLGDSYSKMIKGE